MDASEVVEVIVVLWSRFWEELCHQRCNGRAEDALTCGYVSATHTTRRRAQRRPFLSSVITPWLQARCSSYFSHLARIRCVAPDHLPLLQYAAPASPGSAAMGLMHGVPSGPRHGMERVRWNSPGQCSKRSLSLIPIPTIWFGCIFLRRCGTSPCDPGLLGASVPYTSWKEGRDLAGGSWCIRLAAPVALLRSALSTVS